MFGPPQTLVWDAAGIPLSLRAGELGRSQRAQLGSSPGSAWAALPPSLDVSLRPRFKSSPGPFSLRRRWGRDLRSLSRAGSINHPVTSHPARGGPLQHSLSHPMGSLRSFLLPVGWQGARNRAGVKSLGGLLPSSHV